MDIKGDFLRKACREGSGRFNFAGSKMVIAAMAAAAVTHHAEQVPVVRMHCIGLGCRYLAVDDPVWLLGNQSDAGTIS